MLGFLRELWEKLWTEGVREASTDTEFTAEVVRITDVYKHPNADKLEIALFELAGSGQANYECVIQTGSFKVGQLAVYFSVDCILPTDHPDFKFLTTRLDGAGKTHYRLKAARLRGVFSQGLLCPAQSHHGFGDKIADEYGVTYYRAPEPWEKTPVNGVPKKQRQPIPEYKVDSLKKIPRLFDDGEMVVITEKVHGTNFRFGWIRRRFLGLPLGWRWVVGSHHVIKTGASGAGWYGEDLFTQSADSMKLREIAGKAKGKVFYGELYGHTPTGKRIQDLTYSEKGTGLVIFDVMDEDFDPSEAWLNPADRLELVTKLGLKSVPVLYVGPSSQKVVDQLAEGTSVLDGGLTIKEGCVVETLEGKRKKAKFVGQLYLMRKQQEQEAA